MKPLLLVLTLGSCALAVAQAPPPWGEPFSLGKSAAYQCVRADKPIVIDGSLDDPAWARAQEIEHFVVPPRMNWIEFRMITARRARSQSHARLMWDDKYLYLGAELEDRDIYCATPAGHDNPFGPDDIIELFVKPSDEQPWYWEFHVVPSSCTRDYFYARRGSGGDKRWMKYESGMEAKVTVVGTFDDWSDRDNKWIAEMRLPWSAFDRWGGKPQVGDTWRFLVSRYDYSVHLEDGSELSAAAPLPWQNYHLFEYYPYMVFR
ncbi:carbohydrate-binding family 9-like protein [bacterium]|nr:carbohydrate-binding family 9-like protein [bacterium]